MPEPTFRFESWHAGLVVFLVIAGMVVASAAGLPPFAEPDPAAPHQQAGVSPTAPRTDGPAAPPVVTPSGPLEPDRGSRGSRGASSPPAPETTCVRQRSDVRFTVLSFNTYSARRLSLARMTQVAREIRAARADVVLLQEVSRNRNGSALADQPAFYARLLGMEWVFGANEPRGPGEYGVATLSRYPIVDWSNIRLPHQPGLPGTFQRGLLNTRIRIGKTVVSVYNTHLQPGYSALRTRQMRTVAATVGADPLPTVVGGDLNSAPGSTMLDIARTRLRDAWVDAGSGSGLTHPARSPRNRIDYLLYGDPLVPRSAQTLTSAVSDHRAVRARFSLDVDGEPVCLPVFQDPLEQQD